MLYQREYKINDNISIVIPTVGEIISDEDNYYGLLSMITSMPIDLMVQLDDVGIDFTKVSAWEVFLISFDAIKAQDTKLIFGALDLTKFQLMENKENKEVMLVDLENEIVIDRAVYEKIATVLRKIHHIQKNTRKPANDEAKRYMLERERVKQKRKRRTSKESVLESLIVSLVNTEQFKYNFESVLNISIYQFNESLKQIVKVKNYDNTMHGVYAGTIDVKDLKPDELTWLSNNQ